MLDAGAGVGVELGRTGELADGDGLLLLLLDDLLDRMGDGGHFLLRPIFQRAEKCQFGDNRRRHKERIAPARKLFLELVGKILFSGKIEQKISVERQ